MKHLLILAGLVASGVAFAMEPPPPAGPAPQGEPSFKTPWRDEAKRGEWHKELKGGMREFSADQFAQIKQHMVERTETHITRLTELNSCLKAATTPQALEACHKAMREKHDALRQKLREDRQERRFEKEADHRQEHRRPPAPRDEPRAPR